MDFNLDGDFGKISSFKVDMSDLDFSPKKTGKSKEQSGEDSVNRNHQGKQDNFAFSFDFNEWVHENLVGTFEVLYCFYGIYMTFQNL